MVQFVQVGFLLSHLTFRFRHVEHVIASGLIEDEDDVRPIIRNVSVPSEATERRLGLREESAEGGRWDKWLWDGTRLRGRGADGGSEWGSADHILSN